MLRLICFIAFCAAVARAQVPEWIWYSSEAKPNEVCYFRRTFHCGPSSQKAELTCTADDEFSLFVNGSLVGSSSDWRKPVTLDILNKIHTGENVFAIRAKNVSSSGGLLFKFELRSQNGGGTFVVSDSSWLTTTNEQHGWEGASFAPSNWKPAVSLGKHGIAPWGEILEAPHATPAESLTLLPGFKAELVKSADRDEGSWICMTIDDKGRFIISPEKEERSVLRVTVSKTGQLLKTEKILPQMHAAMGMCYAFGSLYFNGHGPQGVGLYRLTDKNHNDTWEANEITLLKNFDGNNEHGYHAVVLGPDKNIYVMNGNHTKVPPGVSSDCPYSNYAEDLVLPRQWDANGHAKGIYAPGGYVLRTDKDGKKWDLICGGFRNTYDFDFAPNGEMFTFDSDMEWDVGAPWYRPTRINHIVSGGEYGWRSGTGKWPVYYHDSLPSTLDIGLSSPTGVKFGTNSKFPPKYRDTMFACDWAYGKIFAVHLKPAGASYSGTFETFVSGKPLNVVDLEFGKDGAMYFIIGGWKTQSGLYRITYVGAPQKRETATAAEERELKIATQQRDIRHKLESFHGKRNPAAVNVAWPYLDSPDRWLRFAARVAIESQDVAQWQQRALAEEKPEAAITALLALSRTADKKLQPKITARLAHFLTQPLKEEQMLELLRTLQVCFTRLGKPDAATADSVTRALSFFYPAETENVNRELSQLLVYLGWPDVLHETLQLMAKAPTQQEQMYYAFVLRNVTNGWTLEQRKTYFSWFNKALSEYKGGNSFEKYLINIRNEAAETLTVGEKADLAAILQGPAAAPLPAIPPRTFVKEWKLEDLAGDLSKVSKGRSFKKGREAFLAAQCVLCHRIGNDGRSVGPELTGVSGRFNRHDLLDNILSPSKVISDRYQSFNITKKNGDELTGVLTEETPDKIVLITNLMNNQREEVLKKDIQTQTISKLSPMPEGLLNVLSKEEIFDLLAFLEADGRSDAKIFATR